VDYSSLYYDGTYKESLKIPKFKDLKSENIILRGENNNMDDRI